MLRGSGSCARRGIQPCLSGPITTVGLQETLYTPPAKDTALLAQEPLPIFPPAAPGPRQSSSQYPQDLQGLGQAAARMAAAGEGAPAAAPPPPATEGDAAPSVLSLPTEVEQLVFSHLSAAELAACMATCRAWRAAAGADAVWAEACARRWRHVNEAPAQAAELHRQGHWRQLYRLRRQVGTSSAFLRRQLVWPAAANTPQGCCGARSVPVVIMCNGVFACRSAIGCRLMLTLWSCWPGFSGPTSSRRHCSSCAAWDCSRCRCGWLWQHWPTGWLTGSLVGAAIARRSQPALAQTDNTRPILTVFVVKLLLVTAGPTAAAADSRECARQRRCRLWARGSCGGWRPAAARLA
jgi:hypothetical protein